MSVYTSKIISSQSIAAAAPVRNRLEKILSDKIALVRRQRLDKEEYNNPAYAIHQAALNEKERCYQELIDLLDNQWFTVV